MPNWKFVKEVENQAKNVISKVEDILIEHAFETSHIHVDFKWGCMFVPLNTEMQYIFIRILFCFFHSIEC